jgi:hypothetical protein
MYSCVGVVYLFPTIIMKSIQRRVVSVKKSSYFHEFALQNMKRACDCDTHGLDTMTGMVQLASYRSFFLTCSHGLYTFRGRNLRSKGRKIWWMLASLFLRAQCTMYAYIFSQCVPRWIVR